MLFLKEDINLKPIEKEIYNYIQNNLDKVIYMRIRDLANATFVSTSTILRFCQKFKCQGYADFRMKLFDYHRNMKLNFVENNQMDVLKILKEVDLKKYDEDIYEAINIILECDLLFFVGIGISGIMAEYGSVLFSSLYTFSSVIKDPKNSPVYLADEKDNINSCLIVISLQKENQEVIEYIHKMQKQNLKIISIINGNQGEISNLSDLVIRINSNERIFESLSIQSQIPVIHILEKVARQIYYYKQQSCCKND